MASPVIRIRSDLDDYVNTEAARHGVTPADFVNGVLDAFRFIEPRAPMGLLPATREWMFKYVGQSIALLVARPGEHRVIAAGRIPDAEAIGQTTIRLEAQFGAGARRFLTPLAWVEDYRLLIQPRSDLRAYVNQMEGWGVGVHHLAHEMLG
ncbi:MAG: hypothetical protein Q8P18_21565 [Pseudomonadota bacterium]|nr:hypothetical protein [Pseudomonadota bacterium]